MLALGQESVEAFETLTLLTVQVHCKTLCA